MADRHDWLSWDQYQAAHLSNLARFPTFIVENQLTWLVGTTQVHWEGRLLCAQGIEIWVDRTQDIARPRGRPPQVKTRLYSYHVQQRVRRRVIPILRYDTLTRTRRTRTRITNTFAGGAEAITHVGVDVWPTLGDVTAEVETLWTRGDLA